MAVPASVAGNRLTSISRTKRYPLSTSAEILGIDLKTLRKTVRAHHMTPETDSNDGRVRLLTGEQVLELAKDVSEPQPNLVLSQAIEVVRAREEALAEREAHLSQREKALDERIDRMLQLFDKLASTLTARIEQQEARQ